MRQPVFIICYDITRPATRRRVAALLEEDMVRVQMSVFEARLDKAVADRLFAEASSIVDDGDRLRLYALTSQGLAQSATHGGIPLPEEGGFWLL
jgi:CRISPR-associated protein Cas2